uniref:Uncharacterized protein n=1 Tax=Leersia perrieri TaxID=77586 RepID=A0A0D9XBG7_9ORYZ
MQQWRGMMAINVHIAAVLMVSLVLAATVAAHVDVGEVGEYLQKRSQESRLRNHGGPLHDLVNTATRFHEGLLHRTKSRSTLDVEAHTQKRSTPKAEEASSVESADDHQIVQEQNSIQL